MPLEGEKLDQLLSGLLDGELCDSETELVQQELAGRASVRKELQQLQTMSHDLKMLRDVSMKHSVASASVSAGVLSEARRQAVLQDLPKDHHVLLDGPKQPVATRGLSFPAIGLVAALAASVVLAICLPGLLEFNKGNDSHSGAVAFTETKTAETETTDTETADTESIDHVIPDPSVEKPRYISELVFAQHMVLVVDVELTLEALEQDAIGRVLRSHGVARDEPIVADPTVTKAISETRVTVKPEDDASDAVIYFIRTDLQQIGGALDEIYVNDQEFPHVSFDLAMDNPTARLMETIARSTGTRFAINETFAAPISVNVHSENGFPFSGVREPTRLVSSSQRKRGFSSAMPLVGTGGDLSTVLLIVRAPY